MESIGLLVPADRVARVIGKQGAGLKAIRETTGAKVQVQQNTDVASTTPRRVDLSGGREPLVGAFAMVLQKAFGGDPSCTPTLLIPAEHAGTVAGRGGDNLRKVREELRVRISLERDATVNTVTGAQERMFTMQGEVPQMVQALRFVLGAHGGAGLAGPGFGSVPGMGRRLPGAMGGPGAFGAPGLGMGGMGLSHVRTASTDPDEIQVHVVVPDRLAGAILGKGGEKVKEIAATAQCKVSMTTRDGSSERRVVIMGTYAQCAAAQGLVNEQIVEAAIASGQEPGEVSAVLLVRREAAGVVIGKQGSSLKQIRETSEAKIHLAREEVEGQRPCTISGTLQSVLQAQSLIFELIRDVPVEPVAPGSGNGNFFGGGFGMMGGGLYGGVGKRSQDLGALAMPPGGAQGSRRRGDEADEVTKILVPSQSAGAVIGKQGSGLRQIRESTGVVIEMLQQDQAPQWAEDRVVLLKGPVAARQAAVDAVLRAVHHMHGDTCSLKLLVNAEQVGSVIGKQGNMLRLIRENCGACAQVEREEIQNERLVTVTGQLSQVAAAAAAILTVLVNASHTPSGDAPTAPPPPPQAAGPAPQAPLASSYPHMGVGTIGTNFMR